jgi:hypothetical protein
MKQLTKSEMTLREMLIHATGFLEGGKVPNMSENKAIVQAMLVAADALEFIKSGCLVPPDGGTVHFEQDAIKAATEALVKARTLLEEA